jgi:hypothetical protein
MRPSSFEVGEEKAMIDGLKLTIPGGELITRLGDRIRVHDESVKRDEALLAACATDEQHERERRALARHIANSRRRIEALALIRDHVERDEIYRLAEYDLRFADLLPDDDWFDCDCLDDVYGQTAEDNGERVAARKTAAALTGP